MRSFVVGLGVGLVLGAGIALLASSWRAPLPKAEAEGAAAELRHDEPSSRWKLASQFPSDLPTLGPLALETAGAIESAARGLRVDPEAQTKAGPLGLFDAVATREIDAAFGMAALWRDNKPAIELFGGIPFGPGTAEYLGWYAHGGRALHDDLYHAAKVHGLLCGVVNGAGAWFKNGIKTTRELDRSALGAEGLAARMLAAFGAYPQRVAPGDAPIALQTGKVAGIQGLAPAADRSLMRTAQARHYYYPAWQPFLTLELIVNLDVWNGLGARQRAGIETVCSAAVSRGLAAAGAADMGTLKEMMKEGIDVRRLPDSINDALRTAWTQGVAKLTQGDAEFALVWNSLKQFRADYAFQQEMAQPRRQP